MTNHKFAIVCVDDDPMITSLLSFQLRKIINNKNTFIETYSQPTEVEEKIEELIRFGVSIIFHYCRLPNARDDGCTIDTEGKRDLSRRGLYYAFWTGQ